MDTLLVGGDHFLNHRGLPAAVTGTAELAQRALIRLSVRRGAFPLDPGLGSELHRLRGAKSEALPRLALAYAREALAPMAGVTVEGVTVARQDRDALTVLVRIACEGQTEQLEVELQ